MSIRTRVSGTSAAILRTARRPSPGISTSIRQTSGRSLIAAATACSAVHASAQISQPAFSSTARTPARVGA